MKLHAQMGSLSVVGVLLLAGCASLDARPDLEQAAAQVGERQSVRPAWLDRAELPAPPESGAWTLSERDAVILALANDPGVLAGVERVRAARAEVVQAGLLPNPMLSVELGFPISGDDGGTKVAAGLSTQIIQLLTRGRRISTAEAELAAEVLELADLSLRVAAEARKSHAQVRFAQEKLQPSRDAIGSLERGVEVTRRQLQAGENTILAVNRQSRVLLDVQREVQAREAELRKAEHELMRVIGYADFLGEIRAGEPEAAAALDGLDERALIALVDSRRLDVQAAQAQAEAARRLAGLEKATALGDVEAGAAFERDTGRKEIGPVVSVPIPIFDLGQARGAQADALARMAEHAARDVRNRAISEVRTAWTDLVFARQYAEKVRTEIVGLATQGVQSARASVEAGQADASVVLEAESLLASARLEQIEAEERLAIAMIELERAMGGRPKP